MDKEYVGREEVIKILEHYDLSSGSTLGYHSGAIECAISEIGMLPAADVAEVRHGRWICINKRYGEYECSVCHGMDSNCSDYYGIHAVTEQEFCPSCGAKMDKEVADETCICQPWAEQT